MCSLRRCIKALRSNHNLDVDDKDMSDVVNALKTAGVIRGPQGSLACAALKGHNLDVHDKDMFVNAQLRNKGLSRAVGGS